MSNGDWLTDIKGRLQLSATLLATVFNDAVFLIVWAVIQYGVARVLEIFPPSGIDRWVCRILQLAFAIATAAPIVAFVYGDVRKMIAKVAKWVTDNGA